MYTRGPRFHICKYAAGCLDMVVAFRVECCDSEALILNSCEQYTHIYAADSYSVC